jgi:ribosome maturation factor RimP
MRYSAKEMVPETAGLAGHLETILQGLGLALIELQLVRHKGRKGLPGGVRVHLVIYKPGVLGTEECSRAHRAIAPRLELAFPGQDVHVEVSSPGIARLIKDGLEAAHYRGRGVRCYRTDISDWSAGILVAADETGITLKGKEGSMYLDYGIIAKAKLDDGCLLDAVQEE